MTWTLPIAMAIAGLLLVLVVSYRQVIAVPIRSVPASIETFWGWRDKHLAAGTVV